MAGILKKYAFINAKLRARIGKILTDEFFEGMIRSPSLREALHLLSETSFAFAEQVYNDTGDIKMIELALFERELNLYLEVGKDVSGEVQSFVMALALHYEIVNLKKALRLWFDRVIRGRTIETAAGYLSRGQVRYSIAVDEVIGADSARSVAEVLKNTPYGAVIQKSADQVESLQSVFPFEIGLDHYFYEQLLAETGRLVQRDRKIARRMIGVEIDIQNINWISRFKGLYDLPPEAALSHLIPQGYGVDMDMLREAYSARNVNEMAGILLSRQYSSLLTVLASWDGDTVSRLLLIESVLEQIIMQDVRHILAGYPFTVGILLAYFALKKNEIRKLLTMINAKEYELPLDRIRSLL